MDVKKEGQMLIFTHNDRRVVRYDLKRQQLQKVERGQWVDVCNQYLFFRNVSVNDLKFQEKKFQDLILLVKRLNPNCKNVSTFITKIEECLVFEGYIQEGIDFQCDYAYERSYYGSSGRKINSIKHPITDYDRNVIKFFKTTGMRITIGFEEKYFKNPSVEQSRIHEIMVAEITPAQRSEAMLYIYGHWRWSDIIETLLTTHRFSLKSLLEYLFGYVQPFEGLSVDRALEELIDYCNMARAMGRSVQKYPKYLRSMHDIIRANYNTYRRDYDELAFKNLAREELKYSDDKYCIVIPYTSKDVVREGTALNHCVSSYVDKILRLETYIVFLRSVKEPEESLVTVEVKNGKVVQAKGSYNRSMAEEERAFLKKFCNVKKLVCEVTT